MKTTRALIVAGLCLAALAVILHSSAETVAAQIRAAYMKNVDEPGRIPYQHRVSMAAGSFLNCLASECEFHFPQVPAGKRLVLQHAAMTLDTNVGTEEEFEIGVINFQEGFGITLGKVETEESRVSHHVPFTLYFSPGSYPVFVVRADGGVFHHGIVSFVGYLIDAVN